MAEAREKGRQGGLSPNEIYQQACTSATAAGITLGHTKYALDKRIQRERQKQNPLPPLPATFEEAMQSMPEELKRTIDGEEWLVFQGVTLISSSFLMSGMILVKMMGNSEDGKNAFMSLYTVLSPNVRLVQIS